MDQLVEQLIAINKKDWLDVVGILLPILLTCVIIFQNVIYYFKTKEIQKKIHSDEWKKQFHDDVLRVYGTYYVFAEAIHDSGFAWFVRCGNYNMAISHRNHLLNVRDNINKNLDLARLIFGKNNEDLYRMVEKRIKLQTIIIDKYVEYLNSGKFYEISEKAWNTCISSQSIPIVRKYDYGYIQTNADAYDILLKLCESKELQEIETYLKECVEMHHYDNYDKYFEDYFCIDDKKASVNMDKT